jgi:heme exporter protein D
MHGRGERFLDSVGSGVAVWAIGIAILAIVLMAFAIHATLHHRRRKRLRQEERREQRRAQRNGGRRPPVKPTASSSR